MADAFANKIKRLELENFTCFGKVAMDFSPGINIFIGENGTGKTHLLKVLLMGTNKEFRSKFPNTSDKGHTAYPDLTAALISSYYPPSVRPVHLIKKGTEKNKPAIIKLQIGKLVIQFVIDVAHGHYQQDFGFKHDAVFIPSQEMLSWFEGFVDFYEGYDNAFDPTYFILSKSLSRPIPKGKQAEKAKLLISELEKAVNIQVQFDGRKFMVYSNELNGNENQGFEAPLVATGINKLAQLFQLTKNGAIHPGSILIWDEPEAGLNPKFIRPVAQFLMTLANAGCQIFLATHDYLLPYELSLAVEYAGAMKKEKQPVPPMKFFTLLKGENGTMVESGDTIYDLPYDPIMEGHLQFHEKKEQLLKNSLNL